MLTAVVVTPDICIDPLPLFTDNERHQLLALGTPSAPISEPTNIVHWSNQTVQTYGDNIAVKAGDKTLTYTQLDQRQQLLQRLVQILSEFAHDSPEFVGKNIPNLFTDNTNDTRAKSSDVSPKTSKNLVSNYTNLMLKLLVTGSSALISSEVCLHFAKL